MFDDKLKELSIDVEDVDKAEEDYTVLGVVDKIKRSKKKKLKEKVEARALFIEWIESYLDSIYRNFYSAEGSVKILPGHEGGFVNLDSKQITLYDKLMIDLWESNIPPLLVFYHEIGHVLYTTEDFNTYGKSLTPETFILLNWIEDFYIERQLSAQIYYIKPYIQMLHEIVPDFIDDFEKPHFALHYYYIFEGDTPLWMSEKGIDKSFKKHINTLLNLRKSFNTRFGREKFIKAFQEFYKFCVVHGILTKATPPPTLEPVSKEIRKAIEEASRSVKTTTDDVAERDATESREGESSASVEIDKGAVSEGGPKFKRTKESATVISSDAYETDEGDTGTLITESTYIDKPFKPRDMRKGFDPKMSELLELLKGAYDKMLHDSFKLKKKGKPKLVPRTKHTTSPRALVDPVAIETQQDAIYLEYTLEDFAYTAINLFIDVSGSVGHNKTFNTIGKKVIDLIKSGPYAVYGYGNDVTKWTQKEIDNIMDLTCRDATESPIIGDIILEKKEIGNLNIILSDGDLSNLVRRKDIAEITKQYLFVIVVARGESWRGYAEKYFEPNQYITISDSKEIDSVLAKLKKYIDSKGL